MYKEDKIIGTGNSLAVGEEYQFEMSDDNITSLMHKSYDMPHNSSYTDQNDIILVNISDAELSNRII